jgi:hypothetical protein
MEDQIDMSFLSLMDQAMSILQADEVASSSTRRMKHHRHYVNRLQHDYFDGDCVYPRVILLSEVPYADDSFSKHYVYA